MTSLRNRTWIIPKITEGHIDTLVSQGASALSAPILAARGFDPENLADFLDPKLRNLMPNPSFFKDMDKAADLMVEAIQDKRNIAIWSDYDVDGATSAAILGRYLKMCGIEPTIRIPDRITEGYGPNADGLLALQDEGAELVCILDAGTVAFEPLQAAHDANLDVIVVDHHASEPTLPPAKAVVNPNRQDQPEGYGHVCAAGMTFMFVVAINLRLRKKNYFKGHSPNLMSFLDLVALGTVCDVVPLTTINRAFVMRGLPVLSDRLAPGIAALADVAKCRTPLACVNADLPLVLASMPEGALAIQAWAHGFFWKLIRTKLRKWPKSFLLSTMIVKKWNKIAPNKPWKRSHILCQAKHASSLWPWLKPMKALSGSLLRVSKMLSMRPPLCLPQPKTIVSKDQDGLCQALIWAQDSSPRAKPACLSKVVDTRWLAV